MSLRSRVSGRSVARRRRTTVAVAVTVGLVAALAGRASAAMPSDASISTSTTLVEPGTADLGLVMTLKAPLASGYGPFTITATVTNHGPDAATGVTYTNPMYSVPLQTSTERFSASTGTCANTENIGVSCTLGTLAVGATASVAISGTVVGSELDNGFAPTSDSATVTSTNTDPVSTNDTASLRVTPSAVPAYEVSYVVGYFRAVLGRVPTATEMETWARVFGVDDLGAFARRLLATNTYRAIWVEQQFQRHLGRPGGSGTAFYVRWMAAGHTEDQVLASLIASPESRRQQLQCAVAVAAPTGSGSDGCPFRPDDWITIAYTRLTGTFIPDGLLTQYEAQVRAGASPSRVAAAMVTSGAARTQYVRRLVLARYGRLPTDFELFVWVSGLLHGTSAVRTESEVIGSVLFTNRVAIPYVTNVPATLPPPPTGAPSSN